MRLIVLSVGRWHSGPERALYEHFAERIRPLAPRLGCSALELVELAAGRDDGSALLDRVPKGAFIIALDSRGDLVTSEAIAGALERLRGAAPPALTFLIGGAEGHAEQVRRAADHLWSFGRVTYPHLLMRGLLAEQLYRALTIALDHPYHRGGR